MDCAFDCRGWQLKVAAIFLELLQALKLRKSPLADCTVERTQEIKYTLSEPGGALDGGRPVLGIALQTLKFSSSLLIIAGKLET